MLFKFSRPSYPYMVWTFAGEEALGVDWLAHAACAGFQGSPGLERRGQVLQGVEVFPTWFHGINICWMELLQDMYSELFNAIFAGCVSI